MQFRFPAGQFSLAMAAVVFIVEMPQPQLIM
jgi:hypothetical protein